MEEELKKLIAESHELNKKSYEMLKKVRRYIIIQQITTVLKILIVLVPLILAVVYGLPYIKEGIEAYKETMSTVNELKGTTTSEQLNTKLLEEFLR